MSPVIEATGLSRAFGYSFLPDYRRALIEVSLSVTRGESVALLGPNGAGKTTLHRILNGLLKPDAGTARVLGCPVQKLGKTERQRMAFIAESQELPDELTVPQAANWLRPMYPRWDRAFERRLLQLFRLPERGSIGSFSRGMRMKTACLLSLSSHPEVLFMDEPFAGMDPVVRDEIVEALLTLAQEEQWTLFLSSHDIDDVERLADRVLLLDAGSLMLDSTLDDLQERCRRLTIHLPHGAQNTAPLPASWRLWETGPRYATVIETAWSDMDDALEKVHACQPGAAGMEAASLSLREIYQAYLRPATP
jgi:ABC-2 type transport system ATP-binding protein